MRKSIYSTLFVLLALFSACNDENIPSADFDTMEASALQAVAGDEEVSLSWEALEGSAPSGYYLSWTAGSLAVSGGDMTIESGVKTTTVAGLVNGETYTFSVQPVYANGNKGGKISVKAKPASTRIAATNLIAAAGDGKVRLKWTAPQSENLKEYKLQCVV